MSLTDVYNSIIHDRRDVRTDSLPMMSSPFPTLFICLFYVWLVWGLGPRWMKHRQPYDLKSLIIAYNAFQVVFSTFIVVKLLLAGWMTDYDYTCQPVDYSDRGIPMMEAAWWYYISKFSEFPDTFFFILRKKFSHASVLHVVHHGLMPFSVWWGLKFMPGGHSTFFSLANSIVHIVMYSYYMLAAMGPAYKRFIWWKKYLTTFQMVQFVMIFGHSFQLVFRTCAYPTIGFWYIGAHGLLFFILFSNFYKKEYVEKAKGSGDKKDDGDSAISNGHTISSHGASSLVKNGFGNLKNGTSPIELNGFAGVNGHAGSEARSRASRS